MTWKEFKKFVDDIIKEKGFDENIEIDYIDISHPDLGYKSTTPYGSCDKNGLSIHI